MRLHGDADKSRIGQVATEFTGRLYQRPPRKSAVKRNLRIRSVRKLEVLSIEGRLVLFRVECDAGTYIRSLCHHMGLALGVGAHMEELRRTRSGTFDEHSVCTLYNIRDACVAAESGDVSDLASRIISVDAAIPDLPAVVIRDTAIDAVCRGAKLAGVGVISCTPFGKGETVAVVSQKKEFVCLGKALVASGSFRPGDTGLVVAPTTVFMAPGTYPRGWTKSGKGKKSGKMPGNTPAKKR
jgi:tRNA pseudouridine55 synthase/H/ACA ribonucleoprotein complex subunit 4